MVEPYSIEPYLVTSLAKLVLATLEVSGLLVFLVWIVVRTWREIRAIVKGRDAMKE